MDTSVALRSFPEIRWHGHWIWIPEVEIVPAGMFTGNMEAQDESHGLFRKTFELDQVPESVPTRLTADSRYVLYANGQEVYRGPIRSQPRRLHYDHFDLAPYLRPGNNVIAVYAKYLDVENEIVIAEPFMSYVVHDAVALAGKTERLPELYRRWHEFLVDGYDTIGENWGAGTRVHGWSCTPVKDLVFYTLGVTPAEPGYGTARVAPRLGDLAWAKGSVPTPHGMIHLEVGEDGLSIESSIPVVVDLPDRPLLHVKAGSHRIL